MRASTLFGITIAGLLGLGVVVGAKYAGFFEPRGTQTAQEPPIKVLVARQNLFEGTTTTPAEVMVRDLREDEKQEYFSPANKGKYLPALPAAAHMRVLARSVSADQPLKLEDYQDLKLPAAVQDRLGKDMRAVNVVIPKEKAAGGLIQKDEYVDVYLTTVVCSDRNCGA